MGILSFIGSIFSPAIGAINKYQDRKAEVTKAKQALKVAKINAEARRYELQQEATTNWDIEAMRQSQFSWKDEALMVILFTPFVAAFIPVVQDYVADGFEIVADLPVWYQLSLVGIIAASFGLRWLFQGKISKVMSI